MSTLFRLMALLPLPLLHAVGAGVGWLTWLLAPVYRQRFQANAKQAGLAPAVVRPAIAHAGRLIAETPRLWFGKPVPVEWIGAPLIEAARAQGQGVIFLTPHLGCFEVTAQDFARRFGRITVLYRPARKPWLREVVDTARARENLAAAPTTLAGVRQMLRALKAGEAVGLLPDQVPPEGLGVWAPFFGQPAYTMTLPARLVQLTGAQVILAWGERLSNGAGYRVHLRAAPSALPADAEAAAAMVNGWMETLVRECPQQYLWAYARYKTPRAERQP